VPASNDVGASLLLTLVEAFRQLINPLSKFRIVINLPFHPFNAAAISIH
jgi:hypothetical protein